MVTYMAKGTLELWLSTRSWDGEITLDYQVGLNVITRVLVRGRQKETRLEEEGDKGSRGRKDDVTGDA